MQFMNYPAKRRIQRLSALTLLTVAGGLLAIAPVRAQDDGQKVFISDQLILTIKHAGPGSSLEDRANTIRDRIARYYTGTGLKSSDITVTTVNPKQAVVKIKGHLLVTADANDAAMEHMKPTALAKRWADRLRKAIKFIPKVGEEPQSKAIREKEGDTKDSGDKDKKDSGDTTSPDKTPDPDKTDEPDKKPDAPDPKP